MFELKRVFWTYEDKYTDTWGYEISKEKLDEILLQAKTATEEIPYNITLKAYIWEVYEYEYTDNYFYHLIAYRDMLGHWIKLPPELRPSTNMVPLLYPLDWGRSEELISLAEYAKIHSVTPDTVRQKALRGGFKTARKIGRNWVIDKNEPYTDLRNKTTLPD